jgi:opacity protein-like surface antigen
MKTLTIALMGAVTACAVVMPASAQLVLEANGARAEGEWGGELGAGYSFGAAGFRLTPAAGVFLYQGDNDRYYEDNNGGNPRCRDSRDGQYARDSKCDNKAVKPYGRVEATYSIPLTATVGAGVRISDDVRPYGTVAFPLAPTLSLKGNAGPHYFALGLRVGL